MRGVFVALVGMVLGAALAAPPARALSLRDRLPEAARRTGLEPGPAFDALAGALADTAARSLPIISASAGFTYQYNPQLEIFERTSDTLGPLFLERPDTIGRNKLNFNVSYQYVELNQYDGDSTGSLSAKDPLIARVTDAAGNVTGFTANRLRYDFSLKNHIIGLSFTYGVLDNLDVNVFVPLIDTVFDVRAERMQVATAGTDLAFSLQPQSFAPATTDGSRFGVGDILLRGKYQLPRYGWLRSAAGLQLRLPSGDKDNFQGTGDFEASPFLYLSTVLWNRVEPHANLGIDLRTDNVDRSQARYGVGVDVDVTKRIGIALAFLGRDEFKRSAPAGETSFLHLTPTGIRQEPVLGLDFHRKDYFDFSFGTRAVVWRQIMLFANGIVAMNDDGLRNDTVIPTVGVEGTF